MLVQVAGNWVGKSMSCWRHFVAGLDSFFTIFGETEDMRAVSTLPF